MIRYFLLISRQGKTRLSKYFVPYSQKEKAKISRDVAQAVLERGSKMCNFLDWKDGKLVYKRYASLYFVAFVDKEDNELLALEVIHHFVEILDRYFSNVCELDLIFNFHKAYFILDEVLMAGELQEPSKKAVLRVVAAQDLAVEEFRKTGGKSSKSF